MKIGQKFLTVSAFVRCNKTQKQLDGNEMRVSLAKGNCAYRFSTTATVSGENHLTPLYPALECAD